jgi:prepilin-type N-terminal cleavage/methylation domain-containing protein
MTSLLGRLRARVHGDRGLTLVEMVVVTVILGVVLAAVQTTLIMTNKTVGQNANRIDQTQQTNVAIQAMSKTLRTAVLPSLLSGCTSCYTAAFIQGTKNSVQFYANINNDANTIGPSRVSYLVNTSGDLVESIQPPTGLVSGSYVYCTPGPGCTVLTRVIARRVPTSLAVFTYYDHSGNVITSPTLSAADLASVDSIDLTVQVQDLANGTPPATTMVTRVTLPNADVIAQPSPSP